MPLARHTIQYHAGDIDIVSVAGTTECHGRSRLGLAGGVEHEHHRPPEKRSQVGGCARSGLATRHSAVEQPHHAFGDGNVRACRRAGRHCPYQILSHRPAVQIETRPAGGDLVKGRIDIVRTTLEGLHNAASTPQRPQQPKRHRCFPGTRARRRDNETGCTDRWNPRRQILLLRSCLSSDATVI